MIKCLGSVAVPPGCASGEGMSAQNVRFGLCDSHSASDQHCLLKDRRRDSVVPSDREGERADRKERRHITRSLSEPAQCTFKPGECSGCVALRQRNECPEMIMSCPQGWEAPKIGFCRI